MAADALEIRIAHLEGAYEQIDKRLGNVETALQSMHAGLRAELSSKIDRLDQKFDTGFRWIIGVILVNWITVMLAIMGRR